MAIVQQDGFPDAHTVGRYGVFATWLIIQHQINDPQLMRRYLATAKTFMESGDLPRHSYALLLDLIRCFIDGDPQIYGTQSSADKNGIYIFPVPDLSNVNTLRASMHMSPLDTTKVRGDCREIANDFKTEGNKSAK